MHPSFTPEDLLEYLYKETDPVRTRAIQSALQADWSLREKMAVLQTSRERLDKLIESPRTETILRLLRYAAAENLAVRS
jgi:hypothetical protein